jgi:GAF domain-containing protein
MSENLAQSPTFDELAALRAIVEGTARSTGDEFFRTLVRHLARALGVQHSMVAEFVTNARVRALAYWQVDKFIADLEYDLAGTPCEDVARGQLCHYPVGVANRFPADLPLTEMGIESYLGVPLIAPEGQILGHLCVFDPRGAEKSAHLSHLCGASGHRVDAPST